MLKLEHVFQGFGGRAVLSDINLGVSAGETLALIGASGSGKTTLLRVTLGLVPFEKGYVRINNQALSSFRRREWAEQIGYVPQEGGLFPHLDGERNVSLVPELRGWSAKKIAGRAEELRELVGLDRSVLIRFPHQMSGGQRQRVAIMRAAMMDPAVMLLDEPMGALDPMLRRSLQKELKSIFSRLGKTVVLVTHDLGEAVFLAERVALLHEGRILQVGTYADLALRPAGPFVSAFIGAQRTLPETGDLR